MDPDAAPGILLTVSYDGGGFAGFAPQPAQRTVHGVLTEAVRAMDGDRTGPLRGSSRTDAGVHARGQRVAFDPARRIPPRGWVLGLNARLPPDLAVRRAAEVPRGFDPRAHGAGKRYRYLVLVDAVRDPLLERHAFRVDGPLDRSAVRAELSALVGTHDFRGFRTSRDERVETTRTISRAELVEGVASDPRLAAIDVEGTAFLHNMVRIIVGTVLDVGRGRLLPGAVARGLASGRREELGVTAPPTGLTLESAQLDVVEGATWP